MDRRRFLAAAAAVPVGLAFPTRALGSALGGMSPVALVTADADSHIAVLDLHSGDVVERVPTVTGPRSIESVHGEAAVVGHTAVGVVSILSTEGGVALRAELDRFDEPRYTAVHPRARLAYVTDSAREEVVTLDTDRARVVARARVPGPARHISISPDGRTIWTALGNAASRVAVLDSRNPRRPRLARTIAPPFPAHDVVFAPDGRAVWVTSGSERVIGLYRPGSRRAARVVEAHAPPQHVTFAREKAFVASGDDGTVRRHRADGSLVREACVPVGSYNLTFDWGCLVTPSLGRGTVTFLDANGRVRQTRTIARTAHDACIVHVF
jgi:DNA-binding beta-propeller fold protein YncE